MAKNRINFSDDFVLRNEKIGINTTNPQATLDVNGDIISYTSTASTFFGYLSGISSSAYKLTEPRTISLSGDIVGSVSFDGTANVSIASTIQPNSVALGNDTTGDYVQSISGTSNQITVTGGTGEGSISTISIPNQFTVPQDLTVTRDLQVNRNLNVTGNITVGGTSAYIISNEFRVKDADIIVGYTTDLSGNEVSNDDTANHGGIAVASTVGSPLVNLFIAGIETAPSTYKKIMWFKEGTFAGLNTDAWLLNYAVGIGSTQFPSGTRLAAGSVQFTETDLAVVRNINASGIITATGGFFGNASSATSAGIATYATSSGISTYASTAGIATYATSSGIATYATSSGIATYASTAGIATYASTAGIATYATSSGIATYASTAGIATYATSSGIATYASTAGIATYATDAGVSTSVIGGIASVSQLSVSGITTLGFVTTGNIFSTGIITATNFSGDGSQLFNLSTPGVNISISTNTSNQAQFLTYAVGVGSTAGLGVTTTGLVFNPSSGNLGIGTTNPTSKLHVVGDARFTGVVTALSFSGNASSASFASTSGVSTSVIGGIASVTQLSVSGISTLGVVTAGNIFSTGIITATSFSGDGSLLTGISAGLSISTNTSNQSQFLTYAVGIGSTTGLGVATTSLVFNPSSGNLGIGTTNPLQNLHIQGNLLVSAGSSTGQHIIQKAYELNNGTLSWEGSAGQLFSITNNLTSGSIFSVNDVSGIPSIDVDANGTVEIAPYAGNLGVGTTNPTSKLHVVGDARFTGVITANSFRGDGSQLTGLVPNTVSTSSTSTPQFIGFLTTSSGVTTSILASSTLTFVPSSGNLGVGTTNPSQKLHVQGNARVTGAIYDSTNSPGSSSQVLLSSVTGTLWGSLPPDPNASKFNTNIDNSLYIQPTGTLDIVGVGTTTTQITTLPAGSSKYIVRSIHVTNISNGDAEITSGFIMNARKVPATISVSVGSSGGAGIHTFAVGSASSIRIGMAVTGTGNIGETTGIGSTAGFQYNTYVTSVDGNNITLNKPMSGYATGILQFSPVSIIASRLPVPVGSAVELLKEPMILDSLDSIVVQSTGAGSGIGSTSTAAISQTANSNFLTVTAGAAITNFITSGMLIQSTENNTGIQTNTFVGDGYSPGSLSIPMTKPARTSVANTSYSFTEVVVPQDGALQTTIVYQSISDSSYQNGTGTVAGLVASGAVSGITTTVPTVYYGTGNTYPSVIQSIRVTNISDEYIYPGGDYPVWVGIGNNDTVFSWLAYNMVIPKNSSIELCESPKRLGIGQSIFAYAYAPNTIEIQISAKQKTT
jgi:hypothetical protein